MKVTSPKVVLSFDTIMHNGSVVVYLESDEKGTIELDEIVTKIKQFKCNTIYVKGVITENPELLDLIRILHQLGRDIVLDTVANDKIESIRHLGKVTYVVRTIPPNAKQNDISHSLMGLLKPADEMFFSIESIQAYADAKNYLASKPVTQPLVVFDLSPMKENKDIEKVIGDYIEDAGKFVFRNRISIM